MSAVRQHVRADDRKRAALHAVKLLCYQPKAQFEHVRRKLKKGVRVRRRGESDRSAGKIKCARQFLFTFESILHLMKSGIPKYEKWYP